MREPGAKPSYFGNHEIAFGVVMDIKDFLSPAGCVAGVEASDKSRLLKDLSARAAAALKFDAKVIAREILKRESLGSTGIGGGVAIPHAKIPGLKSPFGVLVRLDRPIDFDAIDSEPVDVIFLLLQPEGLDSAQINSLAMVARILRDPNTVRDLRSAADSQAMYGVVAS
jgi:PTS system nitrogen regulatory IIA component